MAFEDLNWPLSKAEASFLYIGMWARAHVCIFPPLPLWAGAKDVMSSKIFGWQWPGWPFGWVATWRSTAGLRVCSQALRHG